uniref:Cytochrome p450 n=1 Tax=Moniliophthora roreri TaxID=221103 RepID=A0A0W0FRT6_MONRR
MLARISRSTVQALGLTFPSRNQQRCITAGEPSSGSNSVGRDEEELVIDLDMFQLMRPVQDFIVFAGGCGRTLAPVWNNIQSILVDDVDRITQLFLELERLDEYDEDEGVDDESFNRTASKCSFRYAERPPRIQRHSSHLTRPTIIPSSNPSIPTIIITPCEYHANPSPSPSHVPIQDSAYNTRLTVPCHQPTFNQVFPPMLHPTKKETSAPLPLVEKWRWRNGHWQAVLPGLEEQARRGLFSRAVRIAKKKRSDVDNGILPTMLQPILLPLCALVTVVLLTSITRYRARMAKLDAIPTVGNRGFFSSYISAYNFIKNASIIIREGYNRYPNSAFKVPFLDRWVVVISGKEMIEDLRKATDEQLSLRAALAETFHTNLIFGSEVNKVPYHLEVIQNTLTRSIGLKAPDVYDEMVAAFNDEIPETTEWTKVPTLHKVLNIVCRASNRLFVGLPLCRNEEWKTLNIEFTRHVFKATQMINLFPRFIQPLVGWYLNPQPAALARASKLLRPVIVDRLEKFKELGDDWDAPDDLLTWLIKAVNARKQAPDVHGLIQRVLITNMAAIHTTSMAYTHALFNLVSRPELIKPLRDEIEGIIQDEGWTKAAMGKMRLLDSFLKESQRVSSSAPLSISRMPLHDFTFSNGIVVPAGTVIMTCLQATHFDEINYLNPSEFDAFRSYRKREKEGESLKHQMVTPEASYLAFGAGKHACPGRFFAVNELKLLFSHTLLHYDIKLDEGDEKPKTNFFGTRILLDAKTKVMFRKRSV